LERICEVRARDDRVKVITLSRDFGYHAVLLAGLSLVTADRYAMIDVDCEDPPELLREFHAAIEGGADVAYGIRSNRVEPAIVTFFRRLFYYLNKEIADSDIVLWMAEFAMISRQVRDAILAPHTTYVFLRAELGYVGFVRVGVPYVRGVRTSGKSHYNFFNMTRFAVAGFLASSTFPLRLILYLAMVIGLLFPVIVALAGLGAGGIATGSTRTFPRMIRLYSSQARTRCSSRLAGDLACRVCISTMWQTRTPRRDRAVRGRGGAALGLRQGSAAALRRAAP
ncbi:MAG: glycosyltransferase, partial [Chloroflexota bacterium]|nr:glycosyltransferase [Chloroflexota bacterium]